MTDKIDSDDVGYCKPPQGGRFKKGQSGNPKGRPKGHPNLATVLMKALHEKVVITENGQRKVVTKYYAAVKQAANKAASGDLRALQMLTALIRAGEEQSTELSPAKADLTDADQKVIKGMLRRLGIEDRGGEDVESKTE